MVSQKSFRSNLLKAFSSCAKMLESSCHFGSSANYCFLPVYKLVTKDEGEREKGGGVGGGSNSPPPTKKEKTLFFVMFGSL